MKRDYGLIGKKFGRYTILKFDEERTKSERELFCFCRCDCGNIRSVSFYRLKSGRSKSCGCYQKEVCSKQNEIVVCGEYAKIKLGNANKYAIIDAEDLDKANKYYWVVSEFGYVVTSIYVKGKVKKIRLHKLIMGETPKGKEVDYLDQDKLNNRKSNLRFVTPMQNCNNRAKCESWNKLGKRNIYKRNNTYCVRITIMGKSYSVYGLKTIEQAENKIKEIKEKYKKEHNL